MRNRTLLCAIVIFFSLGGFACADVFKMGGDRLVATQNSDGGWDWPLSDPNSEPSNAPNILAPTGLGLVEAYQMTSDPNQLAALQKAGSYLLNKSPSLITPEDGYFAVALDGIFGGTVYVDYVKAKFYTPLAAGAYDYLGDGTLLVDTAKYVAILRWLREKQGTPNLAALDCGVGLCAAYLIGADTSAWIAGTQAEINELDGSDAYDVLGLAGAVLGLATAGADIDPNAGEHAAAGCLADLAGILAGYQLPTGGFTWNSLNKAEGAANETVQETAFAVLALGRFDGQTYLTNIENATAYLMSVELPTGGWENFFGEGENNEVTGECLCALAAVQQAQASKP